MNERNAFIRLLLENPRDDLARLVFADWCEENGEESLAAFLRDHDSLDLILKRLSGVLGKTPAGYSPAVRHTGVIYSWRWSGPPDGPGGWTAPEILPELLFAELCNGGHEGQHPKWPWWFTTEELAMQALSRTLVQHAHAITSI